jgi:uncharacterized coiled-coil protein SlyX
MEEAKKEIIIRTGDKVITADGRVGRVTSVCDCEACAVRGFFEATYEIKGDPEKHDIMISQYQQGFPDFYLIGKNFFGNKISTEEMERRIAEQKEMIEREKEKLDSLRKQLWTLNERMVPDWREREEARHKAAEERKAKKSAEQPDN